MHAEKLSDRAGRRSRKQTPDTKADIPISICMSCRAVIPSSTTRLKASCSPSATQTPTCGPPATCCSTTRLSPVVFFVKLSKDQQRRASPWAASAEEASAAQHLKKFLSPFPHFVLVVVHGDVLQCALVELHCCAHGSVDATAVTAAAGSGSTGGEAPVTLSDTFRLPFQLLPRSKENKGKKTKPAAR